MNKKLFFPILIISIFVGGLVFAESIPNPLGTDSFAGIIDGITTWLRDIALVLAPLMLVIGGVTYMTAVGDPKKIEKGKQIIIYTVIGFIVILLAKSLIDILQGEIIVI